MSNNKQFEVICDECGNKHVAEFSHVSEFGSKRIFAVVCGDGFTDYYTEDRVTLDSATTLMRSAESLGIELRDDSPLTSIERDVINDMTPDALAAHISRLESFKERGELAEAMLEAMLNERMKRESQQLSARIVAHEREEHDACEAGTVGCCIDHSAERRAARKDDSCETW